MLSARAVALGGVRTPMRAAIVRNRGYALSRHPMTAHLPKSVLFCLGLVSCGGSASATAPVTTEPGRNVAPAQPSATAPPAPTTDEAAPVAVDDDASSPEMKVTVQTPEGCPTLPSTAKRGTEDALALALVLDTSGSMTGVPMDMLRDAAAATAQDLDGRHWLSIIRFDSLATRVTPLQRGARGDALKKIAALQAGGGTDLAPALAMAYADLAANPSRRKHVIALTDGRFPTQCLKSVVEALVQLGATMSTVSVGEGADREYMAHLAAEAGGRAYDVADPSSLPSTFRKELVVFVGEEEEEGP